MSAYCQGLILCEQPLIVYSSHYQAAAAAVNTLPSVIGDREAIFLPLTGWTMERPGEIAAARQYVERRREQYPNHRIIFMSNTQEEVDGLCRAGVEAKKFSHNFTVSKDVFHPIEGVERRFDAVYNAQIARWKRHELAQNINRLILIYYNYDGNGLDYFNYLKETLKDADFANEHMTDPPHSYLLPSLINQLYAQSGCGLSLSAEEGANFASIEYLLAGLPVVSTRNIGGRDEFFDSYNCLFAAENPVSVAEAVTEILGRNLDRNRIRNNTVEKQAHIVNEFCHFVNDLIKQHGGTSDIFTYWDKIYCNKLLHWCSLEEFLDLCRIET